MVTIYHLFRNESMYYYSVLEHLEGGELLDHVGQKVRVYQVLLMLLLVLLDSTPTLLVLQYILY